MDITALFDDADSAELALVNMKTLGIFPVRYKIKALHIPENTGRRRAVFGNTTGIAGMSGMGYGNSAGGAGFTFAGVGYGSNAFFSGEPPNLEVRLMVTVEDHEAHRTQSALISNHARRVRMMK
jgi:hypothetical protein